MQYLSKQCLNINIKMLLFDEYIDPPSPEAYIIILRIYSVEMDWALQISIHHITLPLHCNAVVIL